METRYRERIYRGYVTARNERLAPPTIAGLRPRAGYLNQLIKRHFPVDLQAEILELGCGHGALIYFAQRKDTPAFKALMDRLSKSRRLSNWDIQCQARRCVENAG